MVEWINQYAATFTLLINVLMLGVWAVYLQLFWKSYRRQLSANIIISRGAGRGLKSRCIISNMSADAVFIEGILLVLDVNGDRYSAAITNISGVAAKSDDQGPQPVLREGPLKSSEYIDVGEFDVLFERAFQEAIECRDEGPVPMFSTFEIWVVANYGTENALVFVQRRFRVGRKGEGWLLEPLGLETEQVRSGRRRREMVEELRKHFGEITDEAKEPAVGS